MFSYCLSFFGKKNADDVISESKASFLELKEEEISEEKNPHKNALSIVEAKLSSVSKESETYLKNNNCRLFTFDGVLTTISGVGNAVLGYVIYDLPPRESLIQCLNLINTTITEYCRNVTMTDNECSDRDNEDCNHRITLAITVPAVLLFLCLSGTVLGHIELKESINKKYHALDQLLLKNKLSESDRGLLTKHGITGCSREMLQKIREKREDILLSLSEAPLQNRLPRL